MKMKWDTFCYLFALLLAISILAIACAPIPISPLPTSTAKVAEATGVPTLIFTPTQVPVARTPLPTCSPMPLEMLRPARRVVEIKVEGTVAHFRDESFWDKAQFSAIKGYKVNFEADRIGQYRKILSKYGLRGTDYVIEFDEARRSTSVTCDVVGAISKRDRDYYGRFGWFLKPLGLDFINDHFEESNKGLSWEGAVDHIPTSVVCEFPERGVPYAAWAHPIGHCHAHVWWTAKR